MSGNAETDVSKQDGTGNGGETRGHGQMYLRVRHDVDVGLDEAGRLSLANEGGGSSDDRLGTGDIHGLEEEPSAR